jgi:hypothetical protein
MLKNPGYIACLLLLPISIAMAEGKAKNESNEEKTVSGMSIVGNNETPTSLVIIPWKSSEIGQETKLNSNLLNDGLNPVDKAVFLRELSFYKLGNSN